jgi:hypothetical protein
MSGLSEKTHPLFDELSEYRFATRASVWHDDGEDSVREFFRWRARDRQRFQLGWQDDWGLGEELGAAVRKLLEASGQGVAQRAVSSGSDSVGATGREILKTKEQYALAADRAHGTPALLQFDVAEPVRLDPPKVRREPFFLFPGVGVEDTGSLRREFPLNVPGLPTGRRWIAMILEHESVENLAGALADRDAAAERARSAEGTLLCKQPITTEDEAIRTIANALRYETLVPDESWLKRHASRVSLLLSLAPALQGVTNDEGRAQKTVSLDTDCPGPDLGTWVVLCVGPSG